MKMYKVLLLAVLLGACKNQHTSENEGIILWTPYNDSAEVASNANHDKDRMQYKLIQSKVLNKNEVFKPLFDEVSKFSEEEYKLFAPMILEQDISSIQHHIKKIA